MICPSREPFFCTFGCSGGAPAVQARPGQGCRACSDRFRCRRRRFCGRHSFIGGAQIAHGAVARRPAARLWLTRALIARSDRSPGAHFPAKRPCAGSRTSPRRRHADGLLCLQAASGYFSQSAKAEGRYWVNIPRFKNVSLVQFAFPVRW